MKRFLGILFALVLVFSLATIGLPSPVLAQPPEVWVDDNFATATPGWGITHFDNIQDGITAVLSPGTVHVANGYYTENITLKDGVQVLGAGAEVTTIDGGGAGSVVTADSVGSETVLDGFTITGGSGTYDPHIGILGGGMYNVDSSPTVTNCIFFNNSGIYEGGGMCNYTSSPTVTNCTFSNNSATHGGGMQNDHFSYPTVTNCVFSNNSATRGGGMHNNWYSSATVDNCNFSTNDRGGGMYNRRSLPSVTNCTFSNNLGGGMWNSGSRPTVTNCIFFTNSRDDGGGIANYTSSPIVTNCIFSNNSAKYNGGAVYNWYSSPTVINCTFSNNSANEGGGGIGNYNSSPTVTNCILWEDSAPNGPEVYNNDSSPLISYSDIEGCGGSGLVWQTSHGNDGGGNIDAMPLFVDPASNYHLQSGSPCCDTGTNEGAPTEDIEGNPRPIDGDGDGTAITDMGAYEYVPTEPQPPPKVPGVTLWGGLAMASVLGLLMIYMVRRRQTA